MSLTPYLGPSKILESLVGKTCSHGSSEFESTFAAYQNNLQVVFPHIQQEACSKVLTETDLDASKICRPLYNNESLPLAKLCSWVRKFLGPDRKVSELSPDGNMELRSLTANVITDYLNIIHEKVPDYANTTFFNDLVKFFCDFFKCFPECEVNMDSLVESLPKFAKRASAIDFPTPKDYQLDDEDLMSFGRKRGFDEFSESQETSSDDGYDEDFKKFSSLWKILLKFDNYESKINNFLQNVEKIFKSVKPMDHMMIKNTSLKRKEKKLEKVDKKEFQYTIRLGLDYPIIAFAVRQTTPSGLFDYIKVFILLFFITFINLFF